MAVSHAVLDSICQEYDFAVTKGVGDVVGDFLQLDKSPNFGLGVIECVTICRICNRKFLFGTNILLQEIGVLCVDFGCERELMILMGISC